VTSQVIMQVEQASADSDPAASLGSRSGEPVSGGVARALTGSPGRGQRSGLHSSLDNDTIWYLILKYMSGKLHDQRKHGMVVEMQLDWAIVSPGVENLSQDPPV
jgi:hypothetical protein